MNDVHTRYCYVPLSWKSWNWLEISTPPTEHLNQFQLFQDSGSHEGHLESKERFAIKKYLLIIGKKKNMQVLSHTFTYFST
jgi:hypothetical protein